MATIIQCWIQRSQNIPYLFHQQIISIWRKERETKSWDCCVTFKSKNYCVSRNFAFRPKLGSWYFASETEGCEVHNLESVLWYVLALNSLNYGKIPRVNLTRYVKEWKDLPETIEAANTEALKLALRAQARPHWAFEHFLFLYHQRKFTALFLAHTARAQHISAEDGLYCPLQTRHLDLD